jgi:predicted MFS family arabinose efflux permease
VVFAPLVDVFITEFGVQEGAAGLVVTLVWVGSAAPRLPAGWLLTRFSRQRVVLGAGIVLVAASLSMAMTASVSMLLVGAVGMGVASGIYVVAAGPLISGLYPARIGRYIGIHGVFGLLAATVAAPIVTVTLGIGWRWIFLTIAGLAAIVAGLLYRTARGTIEGEAARTDTGFRAVLLEQWRIVLFGSLVIGGVGFVWQGVFNFYDLYLRTKDLPPIVSRNLLTVVFGAGIPGMYLGGRVAERVPYLPLIFGLIAAFLGTLAALILASGLGAVVVVGVLMGLVVHMFFPAVGTFLLDSLPDHSRNAGSSMYLTVSMVLQASGSAVVGALVERGLAYDLIYALLGGGLAILLAVFGVLILTDRLAMGPRPGRGDRADRTG